MPPGIKLNHTVEMPGRDTVSAQNGKVTSSMNGHRICWSSLMSLSLGPLGMCTPWPPLPEWALWSPFLMSLTSKSILESTEWSPVFPLAAREAQTDFLVG